MMTMPMPKNQSFNKDSFEYQAYLETLLHRYPLKIVSTVPFLRVKIGDEEYYLARGGFRPMDNLRREPG